MLLPLEILAMTAPAEVRTFPHGRFEVFTIGGQVLGRAVYAPGWRWSQHVAPIAGTPVCQEGHIGMVISGRAAVAMDGGTELTISRGDLFSIPPGHDSWVLGEEEYISLHLLGAEGYARRQATGRTHSYDVEVTWTGNRGTGTSQYRAYSRDHQVTADGPPPIPASSDPAVRGDRSRWNPEQELTAALAQCHMLWYLHLCARDGVVVTEYADRARGTMIETAGGGGHFTEVVLRPRITVASPGMIDTAARLHEEARAKCFIANSVNFPVRHEPVITVG